MSVLDSAKRKFMRAEEQLDCFDRNAREYFASNPHVCTSEPYADGWETYAVEVGGDIPESIESLAGEAAHNLRCVLDHIVYALSPGRDEWSTYFPVCTKEADYLCPRGRRPSRREEGLGGVPEDLIAIFDAAQPYHRGDDAESHPLACIVRLDNADKHRTIQAASAVVKDTSGFKITIYPNVPATTPIPSFEVEWLTAGKRIPVGEKTEVFRLRITPAYNGEMDVDVKPNMQILLGDSENAADLFLARDYIRDEVIAPVEAKIG